MVIARCSIVPPYLLDRLESAGAAPAEALAEPARRTRALDARLRRQRPARARASAGAVEPGPQRTVSDAEGGTELPGRTARREGEGPTGDVAVDEAYDGLGATWRMLREAFERDSLDDAGRPLPATVHYGQRYDNAFWDGERMVFGDGDGRVFGRFTASVSVIGHELGHGVVQYTADLAYRDQAGALNEHVADVLGVLVEQHALDQSAEEASWLVGAGLFQPGIRGVALRSMAAPGTAYDDPLLGRDPQPAHWRDYVVTDEDDGGVHINSGIPNRAFHLAATAIGGRTWEGAGRIWYDALLDPTLAGDAGFAAFAARTLAAAARRHGEGSAQVDAVRAGWDGVGVAPQE
ncbi:M4 family metallopeptidase [Quadrisphaera sp. DSM 44207]|uniref:M4 family metallopeptidase n=1 Tax=Quadrisphaera sp. DSM 44207 TaxID=1881057 RepID=UPI000884C0C3|nr:M4 family metallopeptidase [Quadrisphaera sp. DSM 44207]SDQ13037.1 Thermolysin metallopeptidase, catalytic domain [Quadrisphaera sp. DSM 44207]